MENKLTGMVLEQGTGFLDLHIHLQFSIHLIEAHLQGQPVNHFRIPEVIQDLQRVEGVPFLLKGYSGLHDGNLFLLEDVHHKDLLIGGHLIQGEDLDLAHLLLSDVECILHFVDAEHPLLFKDAEHPLLLDGDRPLQCDDEDHPLQYDDADHHLPQYDDADHHLLQYDNADHLILHGDADLPLLCEDADHLLLYDDVDHLLQCTDVDHHHLLDEGHPHPCNRDLLVCGAGHLHRCVEYH